MCCGTVKRLAGPVAVGSSVGNIYNQSSNLLHSLIYHIRLVNRDSAIRTVSLYVGATAAEASGTELLKDWSIPIGGEKDLYFPSGLKLIETDFLSGKASAATAITVTVMGSLVAN